METPLPYKSSRNIVLVIILVLVGFLISASLLLLKMRTPQQDNKQSEIPRLPDSVARQPFGHLLNEKGDRDSDRMWLAFVSSGSLYKDTLKNHITGEKIADIVILEGYGKGNSESPKKLKVVIQAIPSWGSNDIFLTSIKEILRVKSLDLKIEDEQLSLPTLEKIFPKNTSWEITTDLKPFDLNDPLLDPNNDFVKMMQKIGDDYFREISSLLTSGLEYNYDGPIIPFSIYPQ